jgi:hypothetical protein
MGLKTPSIFPGVVSRVGEGGIGGSEGSDADEEEAERAFVRLQQGHRGWSAGVPHLQENSPPQDPTVCLGS